MATEPGTGAATAAAAGEDGDLLLGVYNLKKYFPVKKGVFQRTVGHVKAVDNISFSVKCGETLGLVGESGCGKTTAGRCLLRLIEPTHGMVLYEVSGETAKLVDRLREEIGRTIAALSSGDVDRLVHLSHGTWSYASGATNGRPGEIDLGWIVDSLTAQTRATGAAEAILPREAIAACKQLTEVRSAHDVRWRSRGQMRAMRRMLQIIFQDPYASLNPRMTVGNIVGEALTIHKLAKGEAREQRVRELLQVVGLDPSHMKRYPHEFSGGQRQRIGIARALAVSPKLIVADEPVSALDVSIQAQVVNLLQDLQRSMGLTYIFVAHNLSVVEHISNRVAVMYLGKIVELASSANLYERPLHPYTKALLSSVPIPDPELREEKKKKRIILQGDVPTPINPPTGCRFHPRCPIAEKICSQVEPQFLDHGGGHLVACHLAEGRPAVS
ncbi:MAG: ATP-binding cassette domain-containing protein [Candidatus Schekmanbacteria bacterium]|nr:ATP-binding cassette domain-containing protein [Candidatus Schekmanbacteria bacterium]